MASEEPPDTGDGEELTCAELVELITAYLEAALPPAVRRRFDQHLAACRPCVAYLQQLRTTIRLTGRLTPADLPVSHRRVLIDAFRNWKHVGRGNGSAGHRPLLES